MHLPVKWWGESHFVKILSIVREQFQVGEENELVEQMALE